MKKIIVMLLCLVALAFAGEKQKVIFDCDLAGDIDDAFALALLLSSPEFEVLGIVLDHGHTPGRAQVACRMLFECGLDDIPVYVGRHTPGIVGKETELAGPSSQFIWADGFTKLQPQKKNAADFIIENLHKYPNEVILFTVGPVPNMRDVLEKDAEALKLAKKVISMFGSFYMGYSVGSVPEPEWNVRADVGSAQLFVNSGADLTFAGLDVTTFVQLSEDNRSQLIMRNSPLTDALCGLYSLWRYESYSQPDCKLYDCVAVGMALWPELFVMQKVHVDVDERGMTIIDQTQKPNCEIGISINKDEFLRRMMARLLRQNFMRD